MNSDNHTCERTSRLLRTTTAAPHATPPTTTAMSSSSVEPTEAAAATKLQSHVRGHLVRKKRLKKELEPGPPGDEGEVEPPAAAKASQSPAFREGSEVLTSDRSVVSPPPPLKHTFFIPFVVRGREKPHFSTKVWSQNLQKNSKL